MNVISLAGFTKDVEQKKAGDLDITTFSVSVGDFVKGEKKRYYFKCVAFGRTASTIASNFADGKGILLTGKLTQEKWEKDGKTQYGNKIVVSQVFFPPIPQKSENKAHTDDNPF